MPPQDQLIRGCKPGPELRAAEDGGMPKLTGYPIRFNEFTTIHSYSEGHFREQIAPGAVTRTLKENRPKILFNHGADPNVGEMPIAPSELIVDERGVRYDEPELYDADYTRRLIPALRAGEFGSSFKFNVTREDWDETPERSDDNPDAIPERTVTEMRLFEVGPVVWPAYESSSAGLRSLTDDFRRYTLEEMEEFFERWAQEPERLKQLAVALGGQIGADVAGLRENADEKTEDHAKDTSDEGGSPSDTHSTSAETGSHSGSRRAKTKTLYGVKETEKPAWRLPEERA